MPTFRDSENISTVIVPEGDYIYQVRAMKHGLSTGQRTNGCTKYEMELVLEGHDSTVYETLIDHDSTNWKLDTFLKSAGVRLAKDQGYDFRWTQAQADGVTYINPVGLRGWCRVAIEEYLSKSNEKKRKNKVLTFYTDRPKLPRVEQPDEVDEPGEDVPF